MALTPLQFQPGVNREITDYALSTGWVDADKVRFRAGYPETIGGWTLALSNEYIGAARSLHPFVSLSGSQLLGFGTDKKYYILVGSEVNDVTPLRATTAAGDVTFAATTGSTTLTVSDTAHGAIAGDYVTFSAATSLGGVITADVLNIEYVVATVVDVDTYTVEASVAANASDTGNGGAAVVGEYQINIGLDTAQAGTGWGTGTWGRGTWGSSSSTSTATGQLRIWSQDNFGEDLISCVHGGGLYYWDTSAGVGTRAISLSDIVGANSTPTVANAVMVSELGNHVIAFGCDPEGDPGVQDPMTIRFSDARDAAAWNVTQFNQAGELRIGTGSEIVAAVQAKQQIVVITDMSVHVMQYIGGDLAFGTNIVAANTSIAGPNAAAVAGDAAYWMGKAEFYAYNGMVEIVPCTVKDYVFSDINTAQLKKVSAGTIAAFAEVWWFYPSSGSTENDRYVVYNYDQKIWYYGSMARTAWLDRGIFPYPLAASPGAIPSLYAHEFGMNDGSTNPPTAINAYVQSSAITLELGDRFMFADRLIPDLLFRQSSGTPTATMTLTARRYPGLDPNQTETGDVTGVAAVPVVQYTEKLDIRLRGRAVALRVESNATNTAWRLGIPRLDIRTDGRR